MKTFRVTLWKKAPFIRLLVPLAVGIILQRYATLPVFLPAAASTIAAIALFFIALTNISWKYKSVMASGLLLNILLISAGVVLYNLNDQRRSEKWFDRFYNAGDYILADIAEPPVTKPNSFKAEVDVRACLNGTNNFPVSGKMIIYFERKDFPGLIYGERIMFNKKIQPIKNSGNPGAFDYKQYCALKNIYHQVYLKSGEWLTLNGDYGNTRNELLIQSRSAIISAIRKYIPGKVESGIAEALLIGYKEDLDKDLVRAYSETGVVHIIAISGLHLGLIYVMLLWIVIRIPIARRSAVFKLVLVLASLWAFSLLTGASASVLRSAVMFTCILTGDTIRKKASICNSLSASAFILLCYDPYMLWDVGFQLSYLAVIGIVMLQKPIYNLIYLQNKLLDNAWKLVAVSLAAQLLTTPVCIFYFHQFPNYFLLANLLAVPLSSLILFLEIILLAVAWLSPLATCVGIITSILIRLMNQFILFVQALPFALQKDIQQSVFDTFLIYSVLLSIITWMLYRSRRTLFYSLIGVLIFIIHGIYSDQRLIRKLIVYNIPGKTAIDFVNGGKYYFIGDSTLSYENKLADFHLRPSRIFYKAATVANDFPGLKESEFYFAFGKKFLFIDHNLLFTYGRDKVALDAIIISKSARISIESLSQTFNVKAWIFDASNSLWKIDKWKKECELLHLRCFIVPERGAYVLDL